MNIDKEEVVIISVDPASKSAANFTVIRCMNEVSIIRCMNEVSMIDLLRYALPAKQTKIKNWIPKKFGKS